MNRAPHPLQALAAALVLGATAVAQTPENPPPWWRVNDNVTVSLYWDFNGAAPFTPSLAVVPPWYNPTVTAFVPSANIVQVPGLTGNGIGLPQGTAQSGTLALTVDNDPYPDWIKIFWFQYDAFQGAGGSVAAAIEKSLHYDRAIVSQKSVPLGGGWERVTIEAQLIPQPDDEGVDWSFLSTGNKAAIDNLFVSSKCVKPEPDQTGDAMGDATGRVNLTQATNGADCRGVAITEGPAPAFQRRYWVSTRAATAGVLHQVLQLTAGGVQVGTTALPFTLGTAPGGAMDLAVETVPTPTIGSQQYVYALVDGRATPGGNVVLLSIDANTGLRAPARDVTLVGFPPVPPQPANFGLTYDPSGDFGAGTFWVSDQTGNVYEFARSGPLSGTVLNTVSFGPNLTDITGIGYDDTLGRFYGFSRMLQATPTAPIRVNGFEWSGYDFQLTGNRFCGDLTLANGGGPRGGLATGFEVYRRRSNPTSQLNMVCLVDTPNNPAGQQWLYELAGPFSFGWSLLGRCDMRDSGPFHGVPFVGSTMEVRLHGVPNTLFAAMFLGFSNTTSTVGPLPLSLGPILGWGESVLSVSPDVNTPLLAPTSPGEFVFPIAIPPVAALGYTPVFFQWLALDSSVQGFFAMSQAGKTVLYP